MGTEGNSVNVGRNDQSAASVDAGVRRRRSRVVHVGGVPVGGDHPIVVQSMTNTDTADVEATVDKSVALADAGSELVRITVNNERPPRRCRTLSSGCAARLLRSHRR